MLPYRDDGPGVLCSAKRCQKVKLASEGKSKMSNNWNLCLFDEGSHIFDKFLRSFCFYHCFANPSFP